ncbi:cytochrome P450 [Micromonospora chalcea]|uniref:cytochrome P450 n=1 Tax=Micromonospora chalcea TaxID=1874 RepID=UPI001D0C9598|nr:MULTISPECIES: cytochrome P450 [Micromonospora]MCT2278014.1 cytochrome P450 [Micromonospora chalcea]WDQ01601.1 cytochrome P450 [Micromonospora chalcea]
MDLPTIMAAPGTPPCGPPTLGDDGWVLTRYADVVAALTDSRCVVPAAPPGPEGTLAWLRGTVSRFSPPDRHAARRALGTAALDTLDPAELSLAAARLTGQILDGASREDVVEVTGEPARRVPVEVLAERLGLADPAAAVAEVCAVAAAYHPGADPATVEGANRAVAALVAMSPPGPAEVTANRLGLLVQAADATAGLIDAAVRHGRAAPDGLATTTLLAEVLRLDPPVRATRRVATEALSLGGRAVRAGERLLLRFDAANRDPAVFAEPDRFRADPADAVLTFGAGARGCPGQRHALALAAGVVGVLRHASGALIEGGRR